MWRGGGRVSQKVIDNILDKYIIMLSAEYGKK